MAKILLADDDDSFATILGLALTEAGHTITRAHDGKEAVQLYQAERFDLVLTDLLMPEKEGLEVIRDLRRFDPRVKVIAMSGGGRNKGAAYLPVARHMGALETFEKPFAQADFLVAVERALQS